MSIPLSLYISASGTRRCERYAWSASPGNLRRAQFTLLSLKGTSPYTCAVREPQNCTHSRHKNRLSFGQRAASPPAMSSRPQQDAMLEATVVSEFVRLVAVQRCVDIRGLCRRNWGKERHLVLRAPEYCLWGYRCQTVCMQTERSRAVGHSPLGNFPQIVTGVALPRRESSQFHG